MPYTPVTTLSTSLASCSAVGRAMSGISLLGLGAPAGRQEARVQDERAAKIGQPQRAEQRQIVGAAEVDLGSQRNAKLIVGRAPQSGAERTLEGRRRAGLELRGSARGNPHVTRRDRRQVRLLGIGQHAIDAEVRERKPRARVLDTEGDI